MIRRLLRRRAGQLITLVVLLLLMFLALPRFKVSQGHTLLLVGHLSGALGLFCLCSGAILSARIVGMDKSFGGLPRLFFLHHVLGFVAFIVLLAHPLFFAFAAADARSAVTGILLPPWTDWPLWLGWLALISMMLFLAPSFHFFGRPAFDRWKGMHQLSALAVAAGLAHAIFVPASLHLRVLYAALGLFALAAIIWRKALSRRFSRRRARVVAVHPLAERVVELELEPAKPLRYQPGQFIYLGVDDAVMGAARGQEHPFTLSSAPGFPYLRVAVKAFGDATEAMQGLGSGAQAWVEGPYGDFFERFAPDRPQLWIAGGIGIAPFVSRARHCAAAGEACEAVLIYCANDVSRAYYLDELRRCAAQVPGLKIVPHYFSERGPLSADFLRTTVDNPASCEIYVCGPPALVAVVRGIVPLRGLSRALMHTEAFDFL